MKKQVEILMEKLKISEAEALQVIEDDKAIDKGAKLFELDEEQKKVAKQATNVKRSPTVYQFQKRERKADADKGYLLNQLFNAILPVCTTYTVNNAEREFEFVYNDKKYKVVLSAPRKQPKGYFFYAVLPIDTNLRSKFVAFAY